MALEFVYAQPVKIYFGEGAFAKLTTETCVTSLPVPAVVGTAMIVRRFSGKGFSPW